MPLEVIMPKVDMDMASGKITAWYVAEGEAVESGTALFEIETDKAAMEVESPGSGILHHCLPEGSEVPIGQTVAWLYDADEEVGPPPSASVAIEPMEKPVGAAPAREPDQPVPSPSSGDKQRATPLARTLAREAGIDLGAVEGSGVRGRVQGEDVRAMLDAGPSASEPESRPLAVTRSKGGSGTPFLLIHGFASEALSWAPLEAQLPGRSVIRIELPSHGKSPKTGARDFSALISEVRQCFDALDIESAHLVGHSLGGAVALALADTRARKTASVTLIAPAGLGPEINGDTLSGILRATRPESLAPWLRTLVHDERMVTETYARLAMASRSDPALREAQTALAAGLFPDGVQAFDLRAALDRLTVPTRIIWGKSDAIIPWRHALRAPGRVSLNLFEGVGHMPQIEAPGDVARLLQTMP